VNLNNETFYINRCRATHTFSYNLCKTKLWFSLTLHLPVIISHPNSLFGHFWITLYELLNDSTEYFKLFMGRLNVEISQLAKWRMEEINRFFKDNYIIRCYMNIIFHNFHFGIYFQLNYIVINIPYISPKHLIARYLSVSFSLIFLFKSLSYQL